MWQSSWRADPCLSVSALPLNSADVHVGLLLFLPPSAVFHLRAHNCLARPTAALERKQTQCIKKILQSSSSSSRESQGPWQKLFYWRFSIALVSNDCFNSSSTQCEDLLCHKVFNSVFPNTPYCEKEKPWISFQFILNPAMHLCHVGLTRLTRCGCLSCISSTVSAADSVCLLSVGTWSECK